jgi:hypothetical protein
MHADSSSVLLIHSAKQTHQSTPNLSPNPNPNPNTNPAADPYVIDHEASLDETRFVILGAIEELLKKTGGCVDKVCYKTRETGTSGVLVLIRSAYVGWGWLGGGGGFHIVDG